VLWERNGKATDLGSLGGNGQSFWGNVAEGLNNLGHVVGSSSLSDNATFHAFFWSKEKGMMQDLGALPGIANSFAISINDSDDIVGVSTDLATQFVATIWKRGVPTDLNTLIPANPALSLLAGCSINSSGHTIGLAVDGSGAYHGYELIPN
jgi:probable HAF family extracellular repeat protein